MAGRRARKRVRECGAHSRAGEVGGISEEEEEEEEECLACDDDDLLTLQRDDRPH